MNAKKEMLALLKGKQIKCAAIAHYELIGAFTLKVNHTAKDLEKFLNRLDFNYDSVSGRQELFGTVWFKDGTWAERGEYNGLEWWDWFIVPEIPDTLK